MIIAIDGPAASGKGTLARRLADYLGLNHLDTGLTYRAVAQSLLRAGLPLGNEALAEEAARNIELSALDRKSLSDHTVGEAASKVAVMPGVRRALVEAQRAFAARPPGIVMDGRDIGTVVCPDADVKFFITAKPETRARRRYAEIMAGGGDTELEQVLADIRRRDARDMERADSPMVAAADAHLIDTTSMDIETAFRTVLEIIRKRTA